MRPWRILVTGSRDWTDRKLLAATLSGAVSGPFLGDVVIVHGACPGGADLYADMWAFENGIAVERHPADWDKFHRAAGFIRNQAMVDLGADLALAYILDGSRGATHCAGRAEAAGIPVRYHRASRWVPAIPAVPVPPTTGATT